MSKPPVPSVMKTPGQNQAMFENQEPRLRCPQSEVSSMSDEQDEDIWGDVPNRAPSLMSPNLVRLFVHSVRLAHEA